MGMPKSRLFAIHHSKLDKFKKWDDDHICHARDSTIGGRLTYIFTPTGLGTEVKVECACGSKINLTCDENW